MSPSCDLNRFGMGPNTSSVYSPIRVWDLQLLPQVGLGGGGSLEVSLCLSCAVAAAGEEKTASVLPAVAATHIIDHARLLAVLN